MAISLPDLFGVSGPNQGGLSSNLSLVGQQQQQVPNLDPNKAAVAIEMMRARREAEKRYPFIKKFGHVRIAPAIVDNKGGLGEFEQPDSPNNPFPGDFTITIGKNSRNLSGGIADTVVADMVHAASDLSPEFQALKKELLESLSDKEIEFAKKQYEKSYQGKFSGSNFASFDSFLDKYWLDGLVQHLLLPEGPEGPSEIDQIRAANPDAGPVLDKIEHLFKTGELP